MNGTPSHAFAIVDRTRLTFDARLGAGNDTLVLKAIGYQEVNKTIDT